MPLKLKYEDVKNLINLEGDELISDSYKNNKELLDIKCGKCKETYKQTYDRFKRGYHHPHCNLSEDIIKYKIKICVICNQEYKVITNKRIVCSEKCLIIRNQKKLEIDKDKIRRTYWQSTYDEKTRNFKINIKNNNSCEKCGEKNPNLLEFAHYDRNNKTRKFAARCSILNLKKELCKGRFLCIWCHRLETREELDNIKKENLNKWLNDGEGKIVNEDTGIKCPGILCQNILRHPDCFYRRKSGKVYKICKRCQAYKSRIKRVEKYNLVNDIKLLISKCEFCAIKVTKETTCCFDFDHIDQNSKEYSISNTYNMTNVTKIMMEIDKCRLLCCSCHKLRTSEQLNYADNLSYNYDEILINRKKTFESKLSQNNNKSIRKPVKLNIIKQNKLPNK